MNIGSVIRGLLGDTKAGEAKTVELKEGQVVRGVVLSVSDSGKEAVVQIQGTPVRAELETPLQPGQTLNLQVAPPGEGGLPVLKPVSLGEAALASPQSMGEALESLGLTDSKAGREIIQAMVSGGVALTKETAAKLDAIINAKPVNVPVSEWLEAAVISVKRGLPVTAESVKGLQQAVFGPKLHQLLAALETEIGLWMQQEQEAGGNGSSSASGAGKPAAVIPGTSAPGPAAPLAGGKVAPEAAAQVADAADTAEGTAAGQARTVPDESQAAKATAPSSGTQTAATGKTENAAGNPAAALAGNLVADEDQSPAAASLGKGGTAAAQQVEGGETIENGALPRAANGEPSAASRPAASAGVAAAGSSAAASNASAAVAEEAAGRSGAEPERAEPAAATAAAGKGAAASPAAPSGAALLAKLQGVLTELRGTLPQLATAPPADAAGAGPAPAAAQPQGTTAPPAAAGQEQAPAAAQPRGDNPSAAAAPQTGTAPTHETESWVGRVLKLLGAEHEQQAVRGDGGNAAAEARGAAVPAAAAGREAALPQAALASVGGGGDNAADTLKGLLLQVLGSSEAPPAVKEAAGQLVQQLTGQQLLLNTDRTAPFAQVTMFLPLKGPDGQETASVHIQSRRGRKGELDAANCRLWFDLDMKQLGQTLVDVQVVDRIVSLKLHNDTPWVLELLEERREEIKTAVESIGYQLLSLRTEPLPEPASAAASLAKNVARLADYVPDSYKGVDYRI
ncbi:DNA ligase [Paenibacillus sp. BAC0078]